MSLSRHPNTLIEILRRREARREQTAILGDQTEVVAGTGSAISPTFSPGAAQAIEARAANPSGADLYEGRVWEIGGVFKFFTGIATKALALIDPAVQTGDAIVAGAGPGFAPTFIAQYADILIVFDGSGGPVTTGQKMDISIDFACTVIGWTMFAEVAAIARLDLWKTTYAGAPPVAANGMPGVAANRPQLVAAVWSANLVRFPTSGTATYTASSEYSAAFNAPKAADGNPATDWATAGGGAGAIWWRVTWSVAQTLTRVVISDRGSPSGGFGSGSGTIRFSDASTVAFSGLPTGGSLTVNFPAKTGITWVQIETSGSTGPDPGLAEVEGWNLISGGPKASGGVSGWTTVAIAAGDVIRVNLDTNDVAQHLTVTLKVRKT